jgi:hypothetical protein
LSNQDTRKHRLFATIKTIPSTLLVVDPTELQNSLISLIIVNIFIQYGTSLRIEGLSVLIAWVDLFDRLICTLISSSQMLDFYRKTHEDFVKQTSHGALLSICAG